MGHWLHNTLLICFETTVPIVCVLFARRYIAQLERTIEQYKAREKSGGLLGPGGGGVGAANTSFGTPRRDVDDDDEEESSAVRGGAGSADTPAAASVSGDADTSVVESKDKGETEESACRPPVACLCAYACVCDPHVPSSMCVRSAWRLHNCVCASSPHPPLLQVLPPTLLCWPTMKN